MMFAEENRGKRAMVMMNNAMVKRTYALKLMEEAEEELIQARILMDDLKEEK